MTDKARRIADEIMGLSQKDHLLLLAGALECAFAWNNTLEGHDFWRNVHAALCRIAKDV